MDPLLWYRSWPAPQEIAERQLESVPHIVDYLPKLLITDHNYRHAPWPPNDPGFCMLEWDVALDPISRRAFAAEALIQPREVLVASYRFHDTEVCWLGNDGGGPTESSIPLREGQTRTDSFGLGCIYIPRSVLTEFLKVMDHLGFTDYTFGRWYHAHYGQARATWNVHPQHIHDYTL